MKTKAILAGMLLVILCTLASFGTAASTDRSSAVQVMTDGQQQEMIKIGNEIGALLRSVYGSFSSELTDNDRWAVGLLNDRLNALHPEDGWKELYDDLQAVSDAEQLSLVLNGEYASITYVASGLPTRNEVQEKIASLVECAGYKDVLLSYAAIAYPYYGDDAVLWTCYAGNENDESMRIDILPSLEVEAVITSHMIELAPSAHLGENERNVIAAAWAFVEEASPLFSQANCDIEVDDILSENQEGDRIAHVYIHAPNDTTAYVAVCVEDFRIFQYRNRV